MRIFTRFTRPAAAAVLAAAALAVTPAAASAARPECVKAFKATANRQMEEALEAARLGNWPRYWEMFESYNYVMESMAEIC